LNPRPVACFNGRDVGLPHKKYEIVEHNEYIAGAIRCILKVANVRRLKFGHLLPTTFLPFIISPFSVIGI
jgi:hypothetical protein